MKELFWILLIITIFQAPIHAQGFDLGVYAPIYADPAYSYEFKEDNRFEFRGYGHMGATTRGRGSYTIKNDSIYFFYEPLELDTSQVSIYTIDKDDEESDILLSLSISVLERADSSQFGLALINIDREGVKPTKMIYTDENGKLSMTLFKPIEENILSIRWMGYRSLRIRLDNIKSVSAKIRAYMAPANDFVISERLTTFKIQNLSDTSFILAGRDGPKVRFFKQQ